MKNPNSLLPRKSERVVLRRLCVADLADFQAYRHDPGIGLYQGWSPLDDHAAAAFLATMSTARLFQPGEWFQLAIADRLTNRLIGDIGICIAAAEREAEIGFTLQARSQGLGLAAEAVSDALEFLFEYSAVDRVVGITDARNEPSIRLLERLGMRRVATDKAVFRGEPCMEYTYAISRTIIGD